MESQGGPPRRTLRPRRPTWPSRSDRSRTPGKPTCQIRENCSPRPGAPPWHRASRPCLRAGPLPRFRFSSRHHLMRPTKTFEGYGFSDSELHLLCLPETTSRGRGCPGTLLERTHDGDARAPPAGATKPFWLLVDPAQSPMDRLFERVWRGWFRLPHRIHHGVLPGDRGLVAGRRSPPRCGRRLDVLQRDADVDRLGPTRMHQSLTIQDRYHSIVDPLE